MARVRMVTRTILGTKATAVCMNMESLEVIKNEYIINARFESAEKLLNALKKQYETATLKIVAVESSENVEECYGLLEKDFLQYATKLDPETRKALED